MLSSIDHRAELVGEALESSRTLRRHLDQLGSMRRLPPKDDKVVGEPTTSQRDNAREEALYNCIEDLRIQRNAVLPPISRLPDEVLRHIFLIVRLRDKRDWRIPVVISHVCASWRNVAINAAQMWSFVTSGPENTGETVASPPAHAWHPAFPVPEDALDRRAVFLGRSKGALLDFNIIIEEPPISALFLANTYRIASLCLTVRDPFASAELVTSCISAVATTLQCLTLARSDYGTLIFDTQTYPEEWKTTMRGLYTKRLPALREATLELWPLLGEYDDSFVFLTTCRTLKLSLKISFGSSTFFEQLVTTFRCCPRAEDIDLRAPRRLYSTVMDMQRFILPHIKRLAVSQTSTHCLQLLCAPNLTSFDVGSWDQLEDVSLIPPFLHISSPPLERFTARGLDPSELMNLLKMSDSLRSLVIEDPIHSGSSRRRPLNMVELVGRLRNPSLRGLIGTENVTELPDLRLQALVFSVSNGHLCPNLTELSYLFPPYRTLLRQLQEIASSRKSSPTPLRKIKLASWEPKIKAQYDPDRTDALEQELAAELDTLVIGDWWYDRKRASWKPWVT